MRSAAGWGFFLSLSTTGTVVSAAAALPAVHILSPQRCRDHCPGTPDTALHFDRLCRAVQCARSALHA